MPIPAGVVLGGLFEPAARAAVYRRLRADDMLRSMLPGGIHDGKASNTSGGPVPTPYLVIGADSSEIPNDRLTGSGRIVFLPMEILSTYDGTKESLTIADRIVILLDRQERALHTGVKWVCNMIRIDSSQTLVSEDNIRSTIIRVQIDGQPRF